jgi:hypothetical protein
MHSRLIVVVVRNLRTISIRRASQVRNVNWNAAAAILVLNLPDLPHGMFDAHLTFRHVAHVLLKSKVLEKSRAK